MHPAMEMFRLVLMLCSGTDTEHRRGQMRVSVTPKDKGRKRRRVLTWVDCHVAVHLVLGGSARDSVVGHRLDFTGQA